MVQCNTNLPTCSLMRKRRGKAEFLKSDIFISRLLYTLLTNSLLIIVLFEFIILVAPILPLLRLPEFEHHVYELRVLSRCEDPIQAHKTHGIHLLHPNTALKEIVLLDVFAR